MKIARLLLRLVIGGLFVAHGTRKLYGWFGGRGVEGTSQVFDQIGLRPGRRHATAAGIAETGGGAGIALGFATPLAASAVIATMLTAINRVHLKAGPWNSNGGYEYNLVLIAAVLMLVETGPGKLSLDALLRNERTGARWAMFSALAGVAGAVGAHLAAESEPAPPENPPAGDPA
ncbi:MAG: DoxX family protein [Actinobacteria bacterium]|nr:DoxX family protein [Actinomycetota bacterium]